MSLEVYLLLQFSGRVGVDVSSSLNFWYSAVKPSGPGLLFAGRFLTTVLISLLVMALPTVFE